MTNSRGGQPNGAMVAGDVALDERLAAAEEALGRLRDRLSLIGSAAKIGLWEYDFESESLWVSDELAAMYGIDADGMTWPDFVERLHPDDAVADLEQPTPSFPFGEVNEFLFRVRQSDGRYLRVRSRSTTHGVDGTPKRKLGAHIDMSEDPLIGLNDQLDEANERLRHFTYMAGHDLRSPLRQMRQILGMVAADHPNSLPDDVSYWLEKGVLQAERIDRLLSDMLDYATADLNDVRHSVTDIERLIEDTVAVIDKGSCTVTVNYSLARRLRVAASPLAQCVRNLVDNSCKHHHRTDGSVAVTIVEDGLWLRIEIVDDGPGIEENEIDRIFEPFYSTELSTNSGLGLAHVCRTVEKYNASLKLDSEPGVGTTFVLRWPVHAASSGS